MRVTDFLLVLLDVLAVYGCQTAKTTRPAAVEVKQVEVSEQEDARL